MLKRKIKSTMITFFMSFLMLCSFSMFAQSTAPGETVKAMTDKMKTQLNLSDAQYQKVNSINQDFSSAAIKIKESETSRSAKLSKMKELDKRRDASLKTVLNDEQFKMFKEHKKENRKAFMSKLKSDAQ
ncbi:MAG: hypothetical protein WC756_14860 [Taibaiella sp.]